MDEEDDMAGNGVSAIDRFHEDRIQNMEKNLSDLKTDVVAHIQTDDLQFKILGNKIDDLKTVVVSTMEKVSTDVSNLKGGYEKQKDQIETIKLHEKHQGDAAKKILASTWKLVKWLIPGGVAIEGSHRMIEWLMGKH